MKHTIRENAPNLAQDARSGASPSNTPEQGSRSLNGTKLSRQIQGMADELPPCGTRDDFESAARRARMIEAAVDAAREAVETIDPYGFDEKLDALRAALNEIDHD